MKNANKFVSINEMFNYFRSKTNSSYSIETISNLLDKLIQFGIVKKITGNNTSYILTELISPNGEINPNNVITFFIPFMFPPFIILIKLYQYIRQKATFFYIIF